MLPPAVASDLWRLVHPSKTGRRNPVLESPAERSVQDRREMRHYRRFFVFMLLRPRKVRRVSVLRSGCTSLDAKIDYFIPSVAAGLQLNDLLDSS
jgi:hypothetical protein